VSNITIYIPKENGDLKYVADVEDEDRADMALDAVLDELPKIGNQSDTFVAIVDGLEDGKVVLLTLGGDEVLRRPKRAISMSNGAATVEETEEEEPVQPARRRSRSTATKAAPRRRTAAKAEAEAPAPRRRTAAKKAAPAKRGSGRKTPFTRNAKSDD
jgi:hypothetical protein